MKTPLLPVLATLALAACNGNSEPEVVDTRAPDPLASKIANAAPVELPPPVKASVTFRCQPGNKLVYIDFFQGDTQVNFRTDRGEMPVRLKAQTPGQPFTGEGITVTGTPDSVTVEQPGKESLTCKA